MQPRMQPSRLLYVISEVHETLPPVLLVATPSQRRPPTGRARRLTPRRNAIENSATRRIWCVIVLLEGPSRCGMPVIAHICSILLRLN